MIVYGYGLQSEVFLAEFPVSCMKFFETHGKKIIILFQVSHLKQEWENNGDNASSDIPRLTESHIIRVTSLRMKHFLQSKSVQN